LDFSTDLGQLLYLSLNIRQPQMTTGLIQN
jgi:hypothetical protein